MQSIIDKYSKAIFQAEGLREHCRDQIKELTEREKDCQGRLEDIKVAKALILEVAQKTQLNISHRINQIVSMALSTVFGDRAYQFEIEFVQRRGTTEADLWLVRDNHRISPLMVGGGVIDIVSFALRLAVWSLRRTAPVFVLDEPFRNLSADLHNRAGQLLQELSKHLGVQFIIVSHNSEIIDGADRLFRIGKLITVEDKR